MTSTPPSPPGRRWYALLILTSVNAVAGADRAVLAAVLPLLKAEFAFSDTQLGVLTGYGSALSYALLALPIARFADRRGKSLVLSLSMLLWSVSVALTGLCRQFWDFALARFTAGIGPSAVWPVGQALISDYFPPERRSGALAVHSAGDYIGSTIPLIAGGWIATQYGWRMAFLVTAVPGLFLAALQWLTVKDAPRAIASPAPVPVPQTDSPGWREAFASLLRTPSYFHLVLGFSWASFAVFGLAQWMPSFYNRQFGLAPDAAAAMFGGSYGFGALLGLAAGGLIGNWIGGKDPRRLIVFCMLTYLVTFPSIAVVLFAPSVEVAFVAHVIAIMFGAMPSGPIYAMIQNSVPSHLRAFAASLFLIVLTLLGSGGGPLLIGLFSDALAPSFGAGSLGYSMFVVKLLGIMTFVHLFLMLRHLPHATRT